ncbi:MAG: hypothetical protein GY869_32795 [Planctomycetes bacterium]|nr:hypothetical protein [Planctomycetota bacterium]
MPENGPNDITLGADQPEEDQKSLPKARIDVEITEQVYYGKPCYVLKDPAALRYYRLRPPEHAIYKMMDGKNTIEDVLQVLAQRFPSEQFDSQAVMSFIIMLRGANLLQVVGEAGTEFLLKRKEMQKVGLLKKIRREYLFLRIPILDPDKILNWMKHNWGGIIFSRAMMYLTILMMLGALALLIANIDKLGDRKPLLNWINLLYVGPMLLLVKAIHEFGHGLTSKHYDCEVHEMGILFLVFMPMAYCDVSDAWMISQKHKRMWITGAGIVVEVVMAALATYIWAFTEGKTVINQFALNMMLIGTINTLMFNGNPLLRYDGYYFLMDLMELPNLKQKGSNYLWYLLQKYVLGVESANKPIDVEGREVPVFSYAVLSAFYRWFIMFAIVTMVWHFLDPYGWGVVGGIMALGCIYSSLITPLVKFFKFLFTQHFRIHLHAATAVILLAVIGGSVYGILMIDVEQSIEAQCVLRPLDLQPIYVAQGGFINAGANGFVKDGQIVDANDILLVLSDPVLDYKSKDLRIRLEQLQRQKTQALQQGAAGAARVETLIEQYNEMNSRYETVLKDIDDLTIRSTMSGILQIRTQQPLEDLVDSFVPEGTSLFSVYAPGRFEAVTAVKLRDKGRIKVGHAVEIKLWSMDDRIFNSVIRDEPPQPVAHMSSPAFSVIYHGEVPTLPAASQEEALTPATTTYEYELELLSEGEDKLPIASGILRDGMVGRSKVVIERMTLGQSFVSWFLRTIRLDIRL